MRPTRRALIALGSALVCLVAGAAVAQDKPADSMEDLRERLRADKKAVVAEVLQLTDGEAKEFWPVYNAYQSDMVAHYDRLLKLIESYAQSYETMTDSKATSLLKDYLGLERDHVGLGQPQLGGVFVKDERHHRAREAHPHRVRLYPPDGPLGAGRQAHRHGRRRSRGERVAHRARGGREELSRGRRGFSRSRFAL